MALNWVQIIVLGVVQGIAEILPLSASGFLMQTRQLLGLPLDGSGDRLYTALVQLAVWLAICLVFRRDLWACLRALVTSSRRRNGKGQEALRLNRRMVLFIVFGMIPMIPAWFLQSRGAGHGLLWASAMLLLNGLLLFLTDRIGHGKRDVRSATVGDGLCLGVAQAVSVVPGLSRTGLTMAAGVFCGLDLEFSWKFSFLLAVPTLLIQAIVALAGALREGAEFYTPYLAGMALAGVCSYLALRFLRFVIRRNALGSFAYAVWAAALFAFVLYLIC